MATFQTASPKTELIAPVTPKGNGAARVAPLGTPSAEPAAAAAPRMMPTRMVRFAIVGCVGILVNLAVLALEFQLFHTRAWWASAAANLVATFHNYIFNNLWTFSDRCRKGRGFFHGALLYFAVAMLGIGLTTVAYSVFNRVAAHLMESAIGSVPAWVAMLSQLAAIAVGTAFNYLLNKTITWRLHTQPIE